ncbi:hypothetical protein FCL40_10490 [Ferrimonas sediminicola]|uniref:Uncharacterized protein n=1 Tax=Ferrimonas sediminicola TaxID=2569538 RepID=A0A4U1BD97_9GAMM|nr:hypothetical protein [Ferrimonas sediminicola]TKB49059.1 hypothetical protein FCL40_10490 [Ferrimonas sediminicola]
MDDDVLIDLIEQAYDCAIDGQWNSLLERISPAFGGSKVLLSSVRQPGNGSHLVCTTHGMDDLLHGYLDQIHLDPCFQVVSQRPDEALCMSPRMKQRLDTSPVSHWYRRMEADHAIGRIYPGSESAALFAMNRTALQSQYSPREQAGFGVLSAHVGGAVRSALALADQVHQRLSQWQADRVNNDAALAIVRANGSPVFMSQAMEQLLERGGPFRWHKGGLKLKDPWHDLILARAHQLAVNTKVSCRFGSSIPVAEQRMQVVPLSDSVYENAALWLIS